MVKFLKNERWKEFKVHHSLKLRYAISNRGRLLSFSDKIKNGRLLNGSNLKGYHVFSFKIKSKSSFQYKKLFIHRLVAEQFLKRILKGQIYVIHIDMDRSNNSADNLKWATKDEMIQHNKKSPRVIAARKKLILHNKNRDGHKLTNAKVISLKKKLANPNRRMSLKSLAKQYSISEMQLYRIKSGENWSHVRI